ncbi:MAG TPA: DUF2911 domain-containing protein [Flavobacterium sp.]|nr:DUF2911 domain-containing protein [Flavobacterium sp.]
MRKLMIAAALVFALQSSAQVQTPQASPKSEIDQVVGLTTVEVEYYRPAKKGRLVFGDLVPYGKVWRTGANNNTTVDFSTSVEINGQTLPAGEYALFTTPKAQNWEVIFYKTTDNWGLPKNWSDDNIALKTTVNPETLANDVEFFTISVNPMNLNEGALELSWEKTMVRIPFKTPTHQIAMKSIETSLNAKAKASDYYAAGVYLFSSNEDLKKSLEYVNKAIDMQEGEAPFYMLRQKSLIQAANGDKQGAIETAKKSLSASEKAGNADYVKMNRNSILEWSKS